MDTAPRQPEPPEPRAELPREDQARTELPRARVRRRRWSAGLVWIVPLVAALFAGYLFWERYGNYGPEITLRFKDGAGVRVGQTPLRYRGVQVGEVTGVALSEDHKSVEVRVRLQRSAAAIAREGSVFWIVRPEVGIGNITGLSTVITGPEIQALPGTGDERSVFAGLDSAPAALDLSGLKLVLRTSRLGSLQRNSPVYYRGVEVGVVQEAVLKEDATAADLHVLIRERYAPLVRSNSVFWNVSGVSVSGGLFRGVQMRLESMRSLVAGGINFATPPTPGPRVRPGQVFPLHADARGDWLAWAPRIPLEGDKDSSAGADTPREAGASGPARQRPKPKPKPQGAAKMTPPTPP
jgi:paraquat-inducible protein B